VDFSVRFGGRAAFSQTRRKYHAQNNPPVAPRKHKIMGKFIDLKIF
jgi:hypothetical protein